MIKYVKTRFGALKIKSFYRSLSSQALVTIALVVFVLCIAIVYAMSWTLSSSTAETEDTKQAVMGDFDSDGDLDYIAFNDVSGANDGLRLYTNNGSGTFSAGSLFDTTSMFFVRALDADGDSDLDLLASSYPLTSMYLFTNNGLGIFTKTTVTSAVGPRDFTIADFNGDGSLDFVVTGSSLSQALYTNNGHGVFTPRNSPIPYSPTVITAADFNSDGFIDIALIEPTEPLNVMLNSGTGAFTYAGGTVGTFCPSVNMLTVGDIDGDGDIDVLCALESLGFRVAKNNGLGTSFTNTGPYGSVADPKDLALGDFDNDGDLDVEIGADDALIVNAGNELWINDGTGIFSISGTPTEESDKTYGLGIGDIDADGDLDYVAANYGVNRHYKSDQAATSANTAPTAPTSLTQSLVYAGNGSGTVRLSWGSGSDTQTSTRLLQYQVRLGTGAGLHNYISGATSSPQWVSHMMPNGQSRTRIINKLPCGHTYYWTSATVDTGYKSTAATETSFTLAAGTCALTTPSPGGGSTSGGGGGGGWEYSLLHQPKSPDILPEPAKVTVHAYEDLNANRKRDLREKTGFTGLDVTASGKSRDGKSLSHTVKLASSGEAIFLLPASDNDGYMFTIDETSPVFDGYERTDAGEMTQFTVANGKSYDVSFGLKRSNLLAYQPCLDIVSPLQNERKDSDGLILLQRLRNSFGHRVTDGITLNARLVTRRDFFTLLQRTQCIDLPDLRDPDIALTRALLAKKIPFTRITSVGSFADLDSPISRREAVVALAASMHIPDVARITASSSLPSDLRDNDPILSDFLTLRSLGVLPDSLLTVFGPDQGLDATEMPLLLSRAAFRAGRISLVDSVFDRSSFSSTMQTASSSTFLSHLPKFSLPSCFEVSTDRSDLVSMKDILPGDSLYRPFREILSRSTKNSDGKSLWLMPATKRITEFGIVRGTTNVNLDEHVSLLEVLRALLVLRCLPPETPKEVILKQGKLTEGSGESRVPRDRLSGLPRDTSLASRILYRAQDRTRKFDLSLFSFAPELLRDENRSPASPLSIEEGSSLLSSGLLSLLVSEQVMTTQQAERNATELTFELEKLFLEDPNLNSELGVEPKTMFLTRRMLANFFATILTRLPASEWASYASDLQPSLGNAWWDRVSGRR